MADSSLLSRAGTSLLGQSNCLKQVLGASAAEHEAGLGSGLKALRLSQNLLQAEVASQAGISISALKNLENGTGSTVHSLVSVVRALKREDWLRAVPSSSRKKSARASELTLGRRRASRAAP